jgi:ectoine hydroxylase-related dioxygenase (phytanoyl-CoA dioxygenase family)
MSDTYLEKFEKDGFAVVKGLFSALEIAELATAFDRVYAEAVAHERSYRMQNVFFGIANDDALGRIVRMVQWPSYIDKELERVRRDPRILKILEPLLGPNLKQIINQMHWKPPGAAMVEFGFHQDSKSRRPREAYTDLATSYIQTGIAIDPHREENGAMVVCPGSHHLGELPFDPNRSSMHVNMDDKDLVRLGVDPDKVVTLELDPGDLAFWSVNTLHGSGSNQSSIDRRLYINGYVIADNCERGEWAFRDGAPCPVSGEPALVHYEDLYDNPDPHYVD